MQCFTYVVPVKKANAQLIKSQAFENYPCGPRGARTHDPNIKSVVLYQLSWRTIAERECKDKSKILFMQYFSAKVRFSPSEQNKTARSIRIPRS